MNPRLAAFAPCLALAAPAVLTRRQQAPDIETVVNALAFRNIGQ
jgi:hypothetical protein